MGRTFTRQEIKERFEKTIRSDRPLFGSGASAGIIGRSAEAAGVDFIVLYSTGRSRLMGQPTRLIGEANAVSYRMHHELYQVVQDTPLFAGVDANDPLNWDHKRLLEQFMKAGISGVCHNPMIGIYGPEYVKLRGSIGHGFQRELAFTRLAHEAGLYNLNYVWTEEEATEMVNAGSDMIIAHVGGTGGGLAGIPHRSTEEACKIVNRLIAAAKRANPETVCLAHGGPFKDPESAMDIYRYTDAVGYIGASSVERTPVESAILNVVKAFKAVQWGTNA